MRSPFLSLISLSIAASALCATVAASAQNSESPIALSALQLGGGIPGLATEIDSLCSLLDPLTAPGDLLCHKSAPAAGRFDRMQELRVNAAAAVVIDQREWQPLYMKEAAAVRPIASITKLMTAMVVLDSGSPLEELIRVERPDVDRLKGSSSRLRVGIRLNRKQLLQLALMSSENRAAAALARAYPGGTPAFVAAMNRKARALGMNRTRFVDPTGLNPGNVSTAFDLATMANAAFAYPAIRAATTAREQQIALSRGRRVRMLTFHNSNILISSDDWHIGLSKTGYIREAGRCLVMQSVIGSKPVIIVLLDSVRKVTRAADANYIRVWLSEERSSPTSAPAAIAPSVRSADRSVEPQQ
jgi:D-alanyl-D-alanine endopeptidase (penicillin-binding protein 7)